MGDFQSIRVVKVSKGRYCISLLWAGQRYRFYNGSKIGSWSKPQSVPIGKRLKAYEDLCLEYEKAIILGWTPLDDWSVRLEKKPTINTDLINMALAEKLKQQISPSYKSFLTWLSKQLHDFLKKRVPTPELLASFINESHWSQSTRVIVRRHLLALEVEMKKLGYDGSFKELVPKTRTSEKLHRPFKDVRAILNEIEAFNPRLHLCCLLTYGCLLRPHREIRLLTWGDFSDDLSQISLGGDQNKGKRNRIVPVAPAIRSKLNAVRPIDYNHDTNIFSGNRSPYNQDFFKTLWGKFKSQSKILESNQTLYSFRHTGAINVFERTGSIVKLQQVMGHGTLQVTLTYLRGLDVKQLQVDDMPCI
jgi:integrase